jgi:hypothetical protein
MKLLCLLFALFVLVFSARPCCADRDCDGSSDQQQQHAHHPVREKECPGCSPFFSCGSCVGFIASKPTFLSIERTFETPERTYVSYVYPGLKEVTIAVWQPPQIS